MKKKKRVSAFDTDPVSETELSENPIGEDRLDSLSSDELTLLKTSIAGSGEDRSQLPTHDQSDRAQLIRLMKKNKPVAAAVLIVVLALVIGLVVGTVMLVSYWINRPNTSEFSFVFGDEEPYTVPYRDAVRDGILYVDLKKLAPAFGITISGSEEKLTFTVSNNTYLRLENNSEYAVINGEKILISASPLSGGTALSAKAYISATEAWVPYGFFQNAVSEGLISRLNTSTNTLTFRRVYNIFNGDMDTKVPADILFHTEGFTVIPAETEPPKYQYSYSIDISAYLPSITSENLLLANKQNPLGESYKPDVVDLTCPTDGEKQQLQYDAAQALYAMMAEMRADGITDVFVTSSYRTYAHQNWLYYTYYLEQERSKNPTLSDEELLALVSAYSSRPGESEHQTGLCVDFTTDSIGGDVNASFEGTAAFTWLQENAYKFGYILRYPEDKTDVTGYQYESWHYRFVGRDAATEIHMQDLCLEEFLALPTE